MVSWDLKAKFEGHTPHIKELLKLSKKESFSNIEMMKQKKVNEDGSSIWYFQVNNRGLAQREFKGEKVE